jgi:hypothetical protein
MIYCLYEIAQCAVLQDARRVLQDFVLECDFAALADAFWHHR